jgi:hypothetical protein
MAAVTALTSLAALTPLPAWTGAVGAAGAASTWVRYFFPLKVGWTCHESLAGAGATGDETLTVASVGSAPQGRSVTVTEGSSSTAGGVSVPTNAALHYVLTKGGQLVSQPSGIQVAGEPYSISGNTTYPSVHALLSGGTAVSRLQLGVPLSAADRAELKAVLPAGATSLKMSVAVKQSGSSVPVMHTPMGTFHHVLAVRSVLKSIAFTNVTKAASKELAAAVKPALAKELSLTEWYAPGVGPIKGTAAAFTTVMTSCGPS